MVTNPVASMGALAYATGQGQKNERMLDRRNQRYQFNKQIDLQKANREMSQQQFYDELAFRQEEAALNRDARQQERDSINDLQRQEIEARYGQGYGLRSGVVANRPPEYPKIPVTVAEELKSGSVSFSPRQKADLAKYNNAWYQVATQKNLSPAEKQTAYGLLQGRIAEIYNNPQPVVPDGMPFAEQMKQQRWIDPESGRVFFLDGKGGITSQTTFDLEAEKKKAEAELKKNDSTLKKDRVDGIKAVFDMMLATGDETVSWKKAIEEYDRIVGNTEEKWPSKPSMEQYAQIQQMREPMLGMGIPQAEPVQPNTSPVPLPSPTMSPSPTMQPTPAMSPSPTMQPTPTAEKKMSVQSLSDTVTRTEQIDSPEFEEKWSTLSMEEKLELIRLLKAKGIEI